MQNIYSLKQNLFLYLTPRQKSQLLSYLKSFIKKYSNLSADDIFDKLDADRVSQIVKIVGGKQFGQIFITDTNREHIDEILKMQQVDYRLFTVDKGDILMSV